MIITFLLLLELRFGFDNVDTEEGGRMVVSYTLLIEHICETIDCVGENILALERKKFGLNYGS
jgi:hypothetical protein